MLKIWKGATDNNKACASLLADLLKAFKYLIYDLLITTLLAYTLDIDSLNILPDYLTNHKQGTKAGSAYNSLEAILSKVIPEDSILGQLLFNIFTYDMFLLLKTTYFTDYVDDNKPFVASDNIADAIKAPEKKGENLVS